MTIKRLRPGTRNSHSARGHFDNRRTEGTKCALPLPNSWALNLSVILLDGGVRPCRSRRIMNGAGLLKYAAARAFIPSRRRDKGMTRICAGQWEARCKDTARMNLSPLPLPPRFEVLFFFATCVEKVTFDLAI